MNLADLMEKLKANPAPVKPESFVCAACRDTGWVDVDDGLEDGRRVRAATSARCTSMVHQRVKPARSNEERFS